MWSFNTRAHVPRFLRGRVKLNLHCLKSLSYTFPQLFMFKNRAWKRFCHKQTRKRTRFSHGAGEGATHTITHTHSHSFIGPCHLRGAAPGAWKLLKGQHFQLYWQAVHQWAPPERLNGNARLFLKG